VISLNDTPGFGKSGITRMADRRYWRSFGTESDALQLDKLRFFESGSCDAEAEGTTGPSEGEATPSEACCLRACIYH
jgi:hypothetical protein